MASKYCPLCGAHELEWGEGEADDDTVLEFKPEFETLWKKLEQVKERKEGE